MAVKPAVSYFPARASRGQGEAEAHSQMLRHGKRVSAPVRYLLSQKNDKRHFCPATAASLPHFRGGCHLETVNCHSVIFSLAVVEVGSWMAGV